MPPTVTLAVLADRIANLSADVCTAIEEIKASTRGFIAFQIDYERRHGEVVTELNAQKADLKTTRDDLASLRDIVAAQSKEISDLKDSVKTLQKTVDQVLRWADKLFWALFIPLVLGIISFIVGLVTHTIVISFPK